MTKPFIDRKNKQVFTLYKSTSRDRHGKEHTQYDLVEKKKDGAPVTEEYTNDDEYDDGEYYEDEEYDEEYDDEYDEDYDDDENHQDGEQPQKKPEDDDLYLLGFKKDGYDYSKHLRPIGGGMFIPAVYDMNELKKHKGGILELVKKSEPAPFMYGLEEIAKDYVKNEKEMLGQVDDDVIEALGQEGEFEELDDDFILQANGGTLDGLEKEVLETRKRLKALDMLDDDDDYEYDYNDQDPSVQRADGRRNRLVDEALECQLDVALAEFDDDDVGELDKERAKGQYSTEAYKEVFDEFIENYEADHRPLHEQLEILKREDPNVPLTAEEKRIIIARNWEEDDEEEVEVEEDEDEKWDCETILTTYSNIYNHPQLIKEVKPIKLSRKTGMPVGVLNQQVPADDDEDEEERINLGQSRKYETKEDKKLRKKALKVDKKVSREQKKDLKKAFKSEEIKQLNVMKAQRLNKLVSIQY
ncbi:hypothetical protein SAMD00019534_058440 [Acytostelium subglobosum LB1]|uniref:hypothetical protein n=1 Tax=Acytostelium subglobosum LB1 TaxID=1410327 RepID=UPI0006451271|nr:hypothetical protein SAMD00019534_058440 [Acytostelium subglobosum LB1]GAM22669.1 hypothetical protein SAMD00019534_058440 [Acytostelium subglobosum LB1]|eukprot:XP_012754789.1 hypothetical protein SAMD00019534_058440 [Acytostelium subglobosum LB1]